MVRRLKAGRSFGFTLLEMMIVIIIMGILLSIALPIYNQALVRSREAVLKNDLFELRKLISQYTLDKQKAPQSLDDLRARYGERDLEEIFVKVVAPHYVPPAEDH